MTTQYEFPDVVAAAAIAEERALARHPLLAKEIDQDEKLLLQLESSLEMAMQGDLDMRKIDQLLDEIEVVNERLVQRRKLIHQVHYGIDG